MPVEYIGLILLGCLVLGILAGTIVGKSSKASTGRRVWLQYLTVTLLIGLAGMCQITIKEFSGIMVLIPLLLGFAIGWYVGGSNQSNDCAR